MRLLKIVHTLNRELFVPVMATEAFLKARSSEYGYITDNTVYMPFFIDKKAFIFRYIVFTNLPFPCDEKYIKSFITECVEYVVNNRICDFIFQPLSNVVLPSKIPNAINRNWATAIVSLESGSEERFNSFNAKHRYEIRKARLNQYVVCSISPEELYNLLTANEKGNINYTYPSLKKIRALVSNLGTQASLWGIRSQGRLVAGALILHDKECAYYEYGGSIKGNVGWMHLLQKELMDHYHEMGLKKYDLVGLRIADDNNPKYEGLARFKMRFSPQIISGFTFWMPIKNFKVFLFKAALIVRKLITGKEFKL